MRTTQRAGAYRKKGTWQTWRLTPCLFLPLLPEARDGDGREMRLVGIRAVKEGGWEGKLVRSLGSIMEHFNVFA